jgi:hypothetical protein
MFFLASLQRVRRVVYQWKKDTYINSSLPAILLDGISLDFPFCSSFWFSSMPLVKLLRLCVPSNFQYTSPDLAVNGREFCDAVQFLCTQNI